MKIKLKALRVNADLTQEGAAKLIGVTRETLVNWETNKTFPKIDSLQKMCAVYGCTLDDVFIPTSLANSEENQ